VCWTREGHSGSDGEGRAAKGGQCVLGARCCFTLGAMAPRTCSYVKFVRRLLGLKAHGEYAVLATSGEAPGEHVLILCNSIGSPVDSRWVGSAPPD
jgi:hypothetical protein